MDDDLFRYLPEILAVASAVGGALTWLVARKTAKHELDLRLISAATEMVRPLEERVTALESENTKLRERVRTLEDENASLRGELDDLRAENAELRQLTEKPPRRGK